MQTRLPSKSVLLVLRAPTGELLSKQVIVAFQTIGVHGVFLDARDIEPSVFLAMFRKVRTLFPHRWIGVRTANFETVYLVADNDAVWIDPLALAFQTTDPLLPLRAFHAQQRAWHGHVFVTTACTCRSPIFGVCGLSASIAPYVDVLVHTASKADPAFTAGHLAAMRGRTPLMVAGEVTIGQAPFLFARSSGLLLSLDVSKDSKLLRSLVQAAESFALPS